MWLAEVGRVACLFWLVLRFGDRLGAVLLREAMRGFFVSVQLCSNVSATGLPECFVHSFLETLFVCLSLFERS